MKAIPFSPSTIPVTEKPSALALFILASLRDLDKTRKERGE